MGCPRIRGHLGESDEHGEVVIDVDVRGGTRRITQCRPVEDQRLIELFELPAGLAVNGAVDGVTSINLRVEVRDLERLEDEEVLRDSSRSERVIARSRRDSRLRLSTHEGAHPDESVTTNRAISMIDKTSNATYSANSTAKQLRSQRSLEPEQKVEPRRRDDGATGPDINRSAGDRSPRPDELTADTGDP